MYSAAFIWEPGQYDDDFHRLNAALDEIAKHSEGYIGVEVWQTADGTRKNATYYWRTLEALKAFSTHPLHQQAKRDYARWYKGYHVVVSEVLRSYGDNHFAHITPNSRAHEPTRKA